MPNSLRKSSSILVTNSLNPTYHHLKLRVFLSPKKKLSNEDFFLPPETIPLLYDLNDKVTDYQLFLKQENQDVKKTITHCLPISQTKLSWELKSQLSDIKEILCPKDPDLPFPPPTPPTGKDESFKIHGFEEQEKDIVDLLTASAAFKAIGIYGMCGTGKTTLVQKVLKNDRVCTDFPHVIWKSMSNISSTVDLNTAIVNEILSKDFGENIDRLPGGRGKDASFVRLLHRKLSESNKKYLIVLDDLWYYNNFSVNVSDEEFETEEEKGNLNRFCYALPRDGAGGAVIVTTRLKEVAEKVVGEKYLYHLKPLDRKDESGDNCLRAIVNERLNPEDRDDKELVDEIVRRCYGLPLAARILGDKVRDVVKEMKEEERREELLRPIVNERKELLRAIVNESLNPKDRDDKKLVDEIVRCCYGLPLGDDKELVDEIVRRCNDLPLEIVRRCDDLRLATRILGGKVSDVLKEMKGEECKKELLRAIVKESLNPEDRVHKELVDKIVRCCYGLPLGGSKELVDEIVRRCDGIPGEKFRDGLKEMEEERRKEELRKKEKEELRKKEEVELRKKEEEELRKKEEVELRKKEEEELRKKEEEEHKKELLKKEEEEEGEKEQRKKEEEEPHKKEQEELRKKEEEERKLEELREKEEEEHKKESREKEEEESREEELRRKEEEERKKEEPRRKEEEELHKREEEERKKEELRKKEEEELRKKEEEELRKKEEEQRKKEEQHRKEGEELHKKEEELHKKEEEECRKEELQGKEEEELHKKEEEEREKEELHRKEEEELRKKEEEERKNEELRGEKEEELRKKEEEEESKKE